MYDLYGSHCVYLDVVTHGNPIHMLFLAAFRYYECMFSLCDVFPFIYCCSFFLLLFFYQVLGHFDWMSFFSFWKFFKSSTVFGELFKSSTNCSNLVRPHPL